MPFDPREGVNRESARFTSAILSAAVKSQREPGMKKTPLQFCFLLVIGAIFLSTSCIQYLSGKAPPEAIEGVLDLTDWDFDKDGTVNLDGEWEFYWKRHLEPKDFSKVGPPKKTGFISVPRYWNGYYLDGKRLSGEGYATYRLKVLVDNQERAFAFKLLDISAAFTLYINGKKISSAGVAGKTFETSIPKSFPKVSEFISKGNQIEIIFQISNFHHRLGGPWEVIRLGREKDIRGIKEKILALALFLFGSIFIIGLYHLGLFGLRRKDSPPLYFGIFCFLICLRLLVTGERYLIHVFPGMSWELMYKFEYLAFYLSVPVFAMFVHSLFSEEFSKRVLGVIVFLGVLFSCIVLLTPARIFSHTVQPYYFITLMGCIYGIYVLILSSIRKREGALVFLLGFSVLFLAVTNDILYSTTVTQSGFFVPFGLFIFILSQSFFLSLRSSRAFAKVEVLSEDLAKHQEHLEELVDERASELKEAIKQLQQENKERKHSEEALRESEERYRSILEAAPDSITITRVEDGRYLEVNESFCRFSGYSREEALGKTPFELNLFVDRVDRERFIQTLKDEGEINGLEIRHRMQDGRVLDTLFSARPLHYGGEDCLVAVVTVISKLKQAERALRESEEKYRTILESIEEGYFEVDLAGSFAFVNHSLCRITGYSRDELMSLNNREYTTAEMAKKMYRVFNETYRTGNPAEVADFEVIIKHGKKKVLELSASLMRDQADNPIGFMGVVRDVTETKKLQAQLQHAQKMESIGTIASGVAHNFRNILAGISLNNQLIEMKHKSSKPLMEIAGRVRDAVTRGARLVDGLMQFSYKKGTRDLKLLNLVDEIREIYDLISKSFDKKIDIQMDLPESIPVMGDHSGLSQVIMNMSTNARDVMPEGGVLRIEARNEGDNALIIISDTGHGMDKEAQERCFDPFYTSKDVDKGTGLGLSTSYGIIKDHGGDVHVYSEPELGTTFKIYLPMVPQKEERAKVTNPEVIHGRGQKVLIVDDDQEMVKPMDEMLKGLGYLIRSVASGKEALTEYESWRPDAVLLDRNMPEMDGIICAKKIIEHDPTAKIILISGYEEKGPNGIDSLTKQIIKGYLTKPIDMVKLSLVLGRLFK